jgi:hypothetical protein
VRNRAVVLYLAALGATTTVLLGGKDPLPADVGLYAFVTRKVSPLVLSSALIFAIVASVFVLKLSIRFRSLFIEYTYSLNRIRRAFEVADVQLPPFLVLPTRMPDFRLGRRDAAGDVHFFLALVSALVVGTAILSRLYRLGLHGWLPPVVAFLGTAAWVLVWVWLLQRRVQATLDRLWDRCREAVRDEIASEAHELWRKGGRDAESNWLEAEKIVKDRWGQRSRARCKGAGKLL